MVADYQSILQTILRDDPGTRELLNRLKKFSCLPLTIACKGSNPHSIKQNIIWCVIPYPYS